LKVELAVMAASASDARPMCLEEVQMEGMADTAGTWCSFAMPPDVISVP
jgi:hypothetical protein